MKSMVDSAGHEVRGQQRVNHTSLDLMRTSRILSNEAKQIR